MNEKNEKNTETEKLASVRIPEGSPSAFVIAGIDDDSPADHPLVDEESNATTDKELEPLVRNIVANGFQGAIEIVKLSGRAYVADGRRRVRAARIANARRIEQGLPGIVIKAIPFVPGENRDRDLLGIVVAANEHRRVKTPLERARQAARLQKFGASVDETATIFGVTAQAIKQWNDLLTLSPKVQRAVDDGKISANAVKGLKKLTDSEQEAALTDLFASGAKPTTKTAAAAANRTVKTKRAATAATTTTDTKTDATTTTTTTPVEDKPAVPPPAMRGKKEIRKAVDRYDVPKSVLDVIRFVFGELEESIAFAHFNVKPEPVVEDKPAPAPATRRGRKSKDATGTDGFSMADASSATDATGGHTVDDVPAK